MDFITSSSVRLRSLLIGLAFVHSEVGLKTAYWILFKWRKSEGNPFLQICSELKNFENGKKKNKVCLQAYYRNIFTLINSLDEL